MPCVQLPLPRYEEMVGFMRKVANTVDCEESVNRPTRPSLPPDLAMGCYCRGCCARPLEAVQHERVRAVNRATKNETPNCLFDVPIGILRNTDRGTEPFARCIGSVSLALSQWGFLALYPRQLAYVAL